MQLRVIVCCVLLGANLRFAVAQESARPAPNYAPYRAIATTTTPATGSPSLPSGAVFGNPPVTATQAALDQLQSAVLQMPTDGAPRQQILVRVRMLEVSRTKMRKIGVDIDPVAFGFLSSANAGKLNDAAHANLAGPATKSATSDKSDVLLSLVDCLVANRLAKVLADSAIVTSAGLPASFNVGGEVPLPAPGEATGATGLKSVGTQIDLVALPLGDNRARIQIRVRRSEPVETQSYQAANPRVPSLYVRQFATTVETAFQQSVALSGMSVHRTESYKKGDKVVEEDNEVLTMIVITPKLLNSIADATSPVGDKTHR